MAVRGAAMSRLAKYAFCVSAIIAALCIVFDYRFIRFNDENYHWASSARDFRLLGQVISRRYVEDSKTQNSLEDLRTIEEFSALVSTRLQDPSTARFDSKLQPLLFDRQEFEDRIVLTVRSTIEYKKRRFWHKDRPLVMEITVFRDRSRFLEIRQHWMLDA
jgi:hypothetical protein